MKKKMTPFVLFGLLQCFSAWASAPSGSPPFSSVLTGPDTLAVQKTRKQGGFFITPYYQYMQFTKLEATALSALYKTEQGNLNFDFSQEKLDMYNNTYGTDYSNQIGGIRAGYQFKNGLGISCMVGISQFLFRSWISNENTQSVETRSPALLLGGAADYELSLWKNLSLMALLSYNYIRSASINSVSTSSDQILSSKFTGHYWEANLVFGWKAGHFLPYAGAGYTWQFITTNRTEQVLVPRNDGTFYTEQDEYTSLFRGHALYALAGLEYRFNSRFALFARGSFPNPARVTTGVRINF